MSDEFASVVQLVRYNPHPATTQTTEAKKNKFEAAEFDQEYIDRMMEIGYERLMAYLQALPEAERKAMEDAIEQAIGHRVVQERHDWLEGGLVN